MVNVYDVVEKIITHEFKFKDKDDLLKEEIIFS